MFIENLSIGKDAKVPLLIILKTRRRPTSPRSFTYTTCVQSELKWLIFLNRQRRTLLHLDLGAWDAGH